MRDHGRRVVDGTGLPPGQSCHAASTAAIAGRRPALEDLVRRVAAARVWAAAHPDDCAADPATSSA